MKDLAVIVAVYNIENQIKECLISLQQQTITNVEFIIIDDGSTDATPKEIITFLKKQNDDRFHFVRKKNGGISDTRNFGIDIANATYIYFLDGDDVLYDNNSLLSYVNLMKENNLDILEFNFQIETYKKNKKVFFENRKKTNVISGKELFFQGINKNKYYSYVWHYMFNLNYIKKNNFTFKKNIYIEDVLFMIPTLIQTSSTMYTNKIGYIYKKRNNSITNNPVKAQRIKLVKDHIFVLNEIKKYYESLTLNQKYEFSYNNLIFRAFFINELKSIGYNLPVNKSDIKKFIGRNSLDKSNKVLYKLLMLPEFILKPICKLLIKLKP